MEREKEMGGREEKIKKMNIDLEERERKPRSEDAFNDQ
jgi:hypothetical protein